MWRLNRIVRLLIALLCAVIAWWVWQNWVRPSLWQLKIADQQPEIILGFDESQGILHSVSADCRFLHGRDILNGEVISERKIGDLLRKNQAVPALSPDKKLLARVNERDESIDVIHLETNQVVYQVPMRDLSFLPEIDPLFALAFSPDQKKLIIRTRFESYVIWDLERRALLHAFKLPLSIDLFKRESEFHHTGTPLMSLDPTGRFLVLAGGYGSPLIYDLATKEIRMRRKVSDGISRISADGKRLLLCPFSPTLLPAWPAWHWLRQTTEDWQNSQKITWEFVEGGQNGPFFLGCSRRFAATWEWAIFESKWVGRLPKIISDYLVKTFRMSGTQYRLEFWDLETGQRQFGTEIYHPHRLESLWRQTMWSISESGRYVVYQRPGEMEMWDVRAPRPLLSWILPALFLVPVVPLLGLHRWRRRSQPSGTDAETVSASVSAAQ